MLQSLLQVVLEWGFGCLNTFSDDIWSTRVCLLVFPTVGGANSSIVGISLQQKIFTCVFACIYVYICIYDYLHIQSVYCMLLGRFCLCSTIVVYIFLHYFWLPGPLFCFHQMIPPVSLDKVWIRSIANLGVQRCLQVQLEFTCFAMCSWWFSQHQLTIVPYTCIPAQVNCNPWNLCAVNLIQKLFSLSSSYGFFFTINVPGFKYMYMYLSIYLYIIFLKYIFIYIYGDIPLSSLTRLLFG